MNKYVNVDKLIAKIKARQSELVEHIKTDTSSEKAIDGSKTVELQWVLDIIYSLQQEQLESSKGKFVFPNFLYARTVDSKTIDVSYAPQSMDAVEYIKNDPTEQQEIDLENEIEKYCRIYYNCNYPDQIQNGSCLPIIPHIVEAARYFYKLRFATGKEKDK